MTTTRTAMLTATMRDSLDVRVLRWSGGAMAMFLLGSLLSTTTGRRTAADVAGASATTIARTDSPPNVQRPRPAGPAVASLKDPS